MTVIAWIVEGTWPACVDAARTRAPDGADIVLLHVTGRDVPDAAHGAYAGPARPRPPRPRPRHPPGRACRRHRSAAPAGRRRAPRAALHPAGTIRADRAAKS